MLGRFNLKDFRCELLFQQVLLQSQERLFVVGHLPHLNNCIPIMRGKVLFAVRTLSVDFDELDNLSLFHLDFVVDVFSYVYF